MKERRTRRTNEFRGDRKEERRQRRISKERGIKGKEKE